MKWKTAKVSSLCDLKNGKAYNADDWATEGLPIIRIQNLNDSSKGFNYWAGTLEKQIHVKPKDLLLAWSGTPGTSFGAHIWNGPEGVLNQHIFRIDILNENIEKRWFQFCLNQQLNSLIHQAHGGVGLKHVTKGAVDALEIPLPPLAEQKRIAAILDAADALRAKRREALAQLDALLQSTFLTLFGDPVTNPMGWKVVLLGKTANRITKGQSPNWQGFNYQESGALFVTSENVREGHLDISKPKFVPLEFNQKLKSSQLRVGDLLINLVGASIGRSCLFTGYLGPANVNQAVGIVSIDDPVLTNYIVQLLQTQQGQTLLTGRIVEAARANVSLANLRELPLPLPPLPLQQKFAAIVESVERQKAAQRAHLAELDALFAALQHRAFRGEL